MKIIDQEVITAAGMGKGKLWSALIEGQDCSTPSQKVGWAQKLQIQSPICLIQNSEQLDHANRWNQYLHALWSRITSQLTASQNQTLKQAKIGILLTSTKGLVEETLCGQARPQDLNVDPFDQILTRFISENLEAYQVQRSLCVSHACASTHVGLEHADFWLKNGICDFVILLSGDLLGPFIFQGFQSLKILSQEKCRPFAEGRDGLQLGEACSVMLLAADEIAWEGSPRMRISAVHSESEGVSVTRPSMNGKSLARCIEKLSPLQKNFDLIIAHGTGTKFNDLSEDQAFGSLGLQTPITGCKWAIGHTLGASGAIDICAASLVLAQQKVFALKNTTQVDSTLQGNYLTAENRNWPKQIHSVLVTSLGFGGIHSALLLEKLGEHQ